MLAPPLKVSGILEMGQTNLDDLEIRLAVFISD